MRFSLKEHVHFLRITYGSCAELETQVMLSKDLNFIGEKEYTEIINLLEEVMKMTSVLLKHFTKN